MQPLNDGEKKTLFYFVYFLSIYILQNLLVTAINLTP